MNNVADSYIGLLMHICGYPKSKQAEKAVTLGWRKATTAERKSTGNDYVRIR